MATIPNEITTQVVNEEVAAELEELATQYEQVANKLRFQAEHLRKGFTVTLRVTASQVPPPSNTAPDNVFDALKKPEPCPGQFLNISPTRNDPCELCGRSLWEHLGRGGTDAE